MLEMAGLRQYWSLAVAIRPELRRRSDTRDEVQRAIARVSQGAGVLLLTDMFGGTPTNIASMFLDEGNVEVVTGVNLPMVIKLASFNREASLQELASEVEDQGKEAICRASILLEPQKMRKDA